LCHMLFKAAKVMIVHSLETSTNMAESDYVSSE
jgi:hypothetical protein